MYKTDILAKYGKTCHFCFMGRRFSLPGETEAVEIKAAARQEYEADLAQTLGRVDFKAGSLTVREEKNSLNAL